jgi:hypothetical protein
MPILYPLELDEFNNPAPNSNLNDIGVVHSEQHSNANDAIEALQRKVGITGSPDPSTIDYKIRALMLATGSGPVISTDPENQLVLGTDGGIYMANPQLASANW